MFGGTTRPHCLLNADARRELPTRRQRASPPRLGRECPVRAVKRFSACDRFSLPDAFCAGVVLPHGRLPHYSRFRLKSQRRNRRKTGGVGTLTAGKAPQKPGSVFKAPPALPPGVFRVSRVRSAGRGGKPDGSAVRSGREGMAVLHRRWDDHPAVLRVWAVMQGQESPTEAQRDPGGRAWQCCIGGGTPPPYCGCVSRIPGAFRVSRTCSGAGQGRRAYRHPPHCGSCRPAPRRSVFACGFWQLKRPGSTPRPFYSFCLLI